MAKQNELKFLGERMKELRKKNNCTMDEMAQRLAINGVAQNKSSFSRVEAGLTSEKTLRETAIKYCESFGMSKEQIEQFMRGEKIAVPDTSALLKNPQLIDELNKEYSKVIISKVVVSELEHIKNSNTGSLGKRAWEVLRGISYGPKTILMDHSEESNGKSNDQKIIDTAKKASKIYHCNVDIITNDIDYAANLKGNETVSSLHLREYMATKQELINMKKLSAIDDYYADNYDECEVPNAEEINAYLPDGNTLIISVVRKGTKKSIKQRKAKIKWLIEHGADVNKRDCSRRYFPPISHAIQMYDYDMFLFLLKECHADPNVGSRNPFDSGKVRQKNEGNMPLMIAAWDGKKDFVATLCKDERTSINQQDANGYTALMKACMNGHFSDGTKQKTTNCRKILIDAGADQKIVDIDGKTAEDHIEDYHCFGPKRKQFQKRKGEKR